MSKTGRPRVEIDWAEVAGMCLIQCTQDEICAVMGVSEDTLSRRCQEEHDCTFADYMAQKRKMGHMSLRRRQWKAAEEGDKTMMVWLGKNWLNQTDRSYVQSDNKHTFDAKPLSEMTKEELDAAYEAAEDKDD